MGMGSATARRPGVSTGRDRTRCWPACRLHTEWPQPPRVLCHAGKLAASHHRNRFSERQEEIHDARDRGTQKPERRFHESGARNIRSPLASTERVEARAGDGTTDPFRKAQKQCESTPGKPERMIEKWSQCSTESVRDMHGKRRATPGGLKCSASTPRASNSGAGGESVADPCGLLRGH